jgi:glycosyltransferase involved in cell wall biosynthesis
LVRKDGFDRLAGLMKSLIVVPFHEPKWLRATLENVRRQTLGLPVLLVLNGAAKDLPVKGVHTITSGLGHAAAVNVGAAWASKHQFSHVVLFDSDDYYGPRYVEKVTVALATADYCGQRELFAQLQDGSVHLMQRPGRSFVFATVGFAVEKFIPVMNVLDNCHEWSERMKARGCSSTDTGPQYYCYARHGQNAHWDGRIPDACVRLAWGPSISYAGDHTVCDATELFHGRECGLPSDAEIFESLAHI